MDKENLKIEESKLKIYGEDYLRIVSTKEAFGWKLNVAKKNKVKKYKTYKLDFMRPVNLPYRERLIELEKMYFDKESTRKNFYQTDILNYILLYLLGIIPGVIYTIVKVNAKKKINEFNENITKSQEAYISEAKSILNNSSNPQARAVPSTSANKPVNTRQPIQAQNESTQQTNRPVQQVRRPIQQNTKPVQQQTKDAPTPKRDYGNDKFN